MVPRTQVAARSGAEGAPAAPSPGVPGGTLESCRTRGTSDHAGRAAGQAGLQQTHGQTPRRGRPAGRVGLGSATGESGLVRAAPPPRIGTTPRLFACVLGRRLDLGGAGREDLGGTPDHIPAKDQAPQPALPASGTLPSALRALHPEPLGHSTLSPLGAPHPCAPQAPLSPAPSGTLPCAPRAPLSPAPSGTLPATPLPQAPRGHTLPGKGGTDPGNSERERRPTGPPCISWRGKRGGFSTNAWAHWGTGSRAGGTGARLQPVGGQGPEERAGSGAARREPPGAMKAACLFLLASLLCSKRALSLQCYNCLNIKETSQCQTAPCLGVCFSGDLVLTMNDGRGLRRGSAPSRDLGLGGWASDRAGSPEPRAKPRRREGRGAGREGSGPGLPGQVPSLWPTDKIPMGVKSCAPNCEDASKTLQVFRPEGLGSVLNTEVKKLACCSTDLCNGAARAGRSLGALAGGLLLSLGPLLLALL
ncbi:hypothetical protein AAY473_031053 [Plecturocebus cupreus]